MTPSNKRDPEPGSVLERLSPEAAVVVIRLRSLGDTVLITPALQLLREARPDIHLSVVLDRPLAPLLESSLFVDRVLPADRGRAWGAIKDVRRQRPELILNLHGGSTSAWMSGLSGARYRAGYQHYAHGFVYNVNLPRAQEVLSRRSNAVIHTAEHHASAVFHLGVPRQEIPPARLDADPEPRSRPYAVLHVAAAYETKRWPEQRFVSIARLLEYRFGLDVVVVAGPGHDHLLGYFSDFERRPGLGVRDLMRLLAGARLFVGNDSGPGHIAAAFGVPCAVVFGSSNSAVWGPWRTRSAVIETSWDCKPCPGDRCYAFDEPRCILTVETAQVEQAVENLLSNG